MQTIQRLDFGLLNDTQFQVDWLFNKLYKIDKDTGSKEIFTTKTEKKCKKLSTLK